MSQIVKGNLPITIWKKEQENAINYRVYGTANGSGVETKNLLEITATSGTIESGGANLTYTIDKTAGTITLNGTSRTDNEYFVIVFSYFAVYGDYIISGGSEYASYRIWDITANAYARNTENSAVAESFGGDSTVRLPENHAFSHRIRVTPQKTFNNVILKLMLRAADTAADFEPYGYKIPILLKSGNLFTETGSGLIQISNSGAMRFGKSLGKLPAGDYSITYTRTLTTNLFITKRNNDNNYSVSEVNPSAFSVSSTDAEIIVRTSYNSDDKTWAELGLTDIVVDLQSDIPIYIGDSQLGEEEYVDYASQKVYKRTENLFDKYAKDTNNGYINDAFLYSSGATKSSEAYYVSEYIQINPNTVYFLKDLITTGISASLCFYDNEKQVISGAALLDLKSIISPENARYLRTSILKTNEDIAEITSLQSTNPPAPFPAITAYKGENTLGSTETIGNVSLEFNEATFYAGNSITQVYTNNQLYDLIDSSFYSLIANSYDSTQTYETDSYCIYNYCLYKCITAITIPETFNPAKWQQLNLLTCVRGDN